MPEFAHPWFLILLLLVPIAGWWWRRIPRPAIVYPTAGPLESLPLGRVRRARWVGTACRLGGLVFLTLAVAGPRWPDRGSRLPAEGIAIEIALDVSGSMGERDFIWGGKPATRLKAAQEVFRLFLAGGQSPDGIVLKGRHDDPVGLVAFARWPETACPLTLSHSAVLQIMDGQRPRTLPAESQTNIGDALAWALHRLESGPTLRRVMILISDGEHNVPPPALTPRQAAQLAAAEHVPVYTIDAGPDVARDRKGNAGAGSEYTIRASGQASLKAIASITGARYFRARDVEGLLQACREIDRLERAPVQSFLYRKYYEAYPWFGLAAFTLWGSIFLLDRTFWLTVP